MTSLFSAAGRRKHRLAGDAHRRAGEWAKAAEAYRRHLRQRPGDAAIWVQLGHAEKEGGNPDAAEQAYREAARIAPRDPDPPLHLAHLLKSQSRSDEAADAFRALFRLSPDAQTLAELKSLTHNRRRRTIVARRGAVLFPLEDIFAMLEVHGTTTGMQRVQAGIALAVMADRSLDSHFIVNGEDESGTPTFLAIDAERLRAALSHAAGERVDHGRLREMLVEARMHAASITFGAGATIVLLGGFWGAGNGLDRYLCARRAGARLIPFIHDIIPITHPQFCDANVTRLFWRGLAELLHAADHVLTNSEHTRRTLLRLIDEQGGAVPSITTIPLAHAMARPEPADRVAPLPRALRKLRRARYVVYVSTIEGRKNHLLVVRAWQAMIARGVDVPDLVFVGREGWRAGPLIDLLAETRNLGGRVHIVHGLSDAELDSVYTGAMFSVFTSIAEGWGLPIGESLSHGVPCVASRTASLPEVGGDFVDYVDPGDLEGTIAALRRMIEDRAYLAERRRNIALNFVARSWREVGDEVVATLRSIVGRACDPAELGPVTLPEGTVFRPGDLAISPEPVAGYFRDPIGLALIEAFLAPEAEGAWLRGRSGEFTFATSAAPGETIVVLLALVARQGGARCAFAINGWGGAPRRTLLLDEGRNLVRLKGRVDPDGVCSIRFDVDDDPASSADEERWIAVGLHAIGYARHDDLALRTRVREAIESA